MDMTIDIKEIDCDSSISFRKEICSCDSTDWVWITITDQDGKCYTTKVSNKKLCCVLEQLCKC